MQTVGKTAKSSMTSRSSTANNEGNSARDNQNQFENPSRAGSRNQLDFKTKPVETQKKIIIDPKSIDILNMLHKKKLKIIEEEFLQYELGPTIDQFVEIMLKHLLENNPDEEDLKLPVTLNLIDLFKEIDVNDDKHMEWVEFSNYIIELGNLLIENLQLTAS